MTAREEWEDYQNVPLAQDIIDEQDARIEKLVDLLKQMHDESTTKVYDWLPEIERLLK
jgi:hypothetical protein